MDKVKRYREMYKRGLITEAQLQKLVDKGVITESQYKIIIAEENNLEENNLEELIYLDKLI